MEQNENINIAQAKVFDVTEETYESQLSPQKKKTTKTLVLSLCIILVIITGAYLINRGIKTKKHDEFVDNIQSVEYLTELINDEIELKEHTYLTDFENWGWHEDDEKTLVYTLRKLEGDETESIHFTFDGKRNTLSRIWCNDMQLFVDFFLPAYSGKDMSDDELSRIIRKNIGLGYSVNGNGTFQPRDQILFNNCIIEVNTYKVEFGEWFFGQEFSIEPNY